MDDEGFKIASNKKNNNNKKRTNKGNGENQGINKNMQNSLKI